MTIIRALVICTAILIAGWLITTILNTRDGCYPWSPKEVKVPFHQGMMLCPGQTAILPGGSTIENADSKPHQALAP